MRILAQSNKGIGLHYTSTEAINSCYIISGKLQDDKELNNISHLAGLMPETVISDSL